MMRSAVFPPRLPRPPPGSPKTKEVLTVSGIDAARLLLDNINLRARVAELEAAFDEPHGHVGLRLRGLQELAPRQLLDRRPRGRDRGPFLDLVAVTVGGDGHPLQFNVVPELSRLHQATSAASSVFVSRRG